MFTNPLRRLLPLFLLLALTALSSSSAACTEPRPTGSAGSATANTYVTGITGYNNQIKVWWKTTNSGTVHSSVIGMGPDTTLTFTGGYTNTNLHSYASRVVKLSTHTILGNPSQHYWMINDAHRLDIWGVPAASGLIYNGTLQYRGASGALWGIGTGASSVPGAGSNIHGTLIFMGADNGAQVSTTRWFAWAASSGCADPQSSYGSALRDSMLARSFFPESSPATRHWWQS